ncbi:tail completion protein gp17, partial [Pseudomonas mosselii]
EKPLRPYAVWNVISGSPENYLAGRPDADGFTLQVDVYGSTGTSSRSVRDAIRDAIELQAYVTRWGGETRDPTTKNYRTSFDVDWIVRR